MERPFDQSSPPRIRRRVPGAVWIIILLIMGFYAYAMRPRTSAVAWQDDPTAALAQARAGGRPVFLKFEAAWCGVCDDMNREVFPDRRVGAALRDWVSIRVDVDKQHEFAREYEIEALPTFVTLTASGEVSGKSVGGLSADELIAFLRKSGGATSQPSS